MADETGTVEAVQKLAIQVGELEIRIIRLTETGRLLESAAREGAWMLNTMGAKEFADRLKETTDAFVAAMNREGK